MDYRSLTVDEIEQLEAHGCTAEDWTTINVADDFMPHHIYNVAFYGEVNLGVFEKSIEIDEGFFRHSGLRNATLRDVTVGDNCLIENIGGYIYRYTIGEECYIANVGVMATGEGATYGQGTAVAVMNEAGGGNVIVYDGLTSQMAAFMLRCAANRPLFDTLADMARNYVAERRPEQGTLGYRVKIANTRELINVAVADDCEISGASRLSDCTISGSPSATVYVGADTICENSVISAGASVLDGARIYNSFVGEACHIGKGFLAESSLFFANSYMAGGEACAAFCGPFSVSHHKSTLLIGGMFSFYNAGSATNFSNHAYKMGPIHYGTLQRGTKTASGAHLLMPATIGCYSMVMGKVQNHPDTSRLPFSYVIAQGGTTYIVPGRNLPTVGTFRDIGKWRERDLRPASDRHDILNAAWLSPYSVQAVIEGRRLLESLRAEQGDGADEYLLDGCVIKRHALMRGLALYDLAIRMYFGRLAQRATAVLPSDSRGTGTWTDLGGLLAPEQEVDDMAYAIMTGEISEIQQIDDRLLAMARLYPDFCWNWAYSRMAGRLGVDSLTDDDLAALHSDGMKARAEWLNMIEADAEKEFRMGDVDEDTLSRFMEKLKEEEGLSTID